VTFYLKSYVYPQRMCIVAKDREMLLQLLECKYSVMFINDDSIIFYPDEIRISVETSEKENVGILENRDIVEVNSNGLVYRSFAYTEPDSVLFLGAKCNSNCIMCPAGDAERKEGFSYNLNQIETYIDYLPDDLEILVVTGGEPTLNPAIFLSAMRMLKDKFLYTQVLLLTNGRTLSNTEFLNNLCIVTPENFVIAIPIHGDTAGVHDYITRVEGSFNETLIAVRKVLDSDLRVELRIVVSKANYMHLDGIAHLISKKFKKVETVNFVGLEPRGNCAKNADIVYIDHNTAFGRMKSAITHLMEHGINVGIYNYPLCSVDRGFWSICRRSISQYKATYHEKCNNCIVKDLCGGLFVATLSFIKPDVYPILAKREKSHA